MMTFTKSFSLELFLGIHDFSGDSIRVALYGADALIDADTFEYSAIDEITGTGYTAGGELMVPTSTYPKIEDGRGCVRFDRVTWGGSCTFSYQKVLIYNASKGNRSIFAIDFGNLRGPENSTHYFELPTSFPPFLIMNRGV